MNNCKNCKEPVNGNYCANCGQSVKLQRIDGSYIFHEITTAFNAEKGILYTLKKMLISPGESVRHYITEARSRYVKPIVFVIITSLIYTLVCHFFQVDIKEFQRQQSGETNLLELFPTYNLLMNWMIDYSGYMTMIISLFVALCVRLFFRKSGYNLFEVFVLFCYISGTSTLLAAVVFIVQGLTNWDLINVTVLFSAIYYTWAIGQFFDKKKVGSYIKATLAHLLGILIYATLLVFISIFIDIVLKQ